MKTIDKCEKANFIHAVQKGRVGTNEDRDVIDAELRNNLLLYGDNLLGRVGMNGNLGQMVLELLPRCAREGLVRRFAKCDEDKNPELLDQVMSSIGEPEKLQAAIDEAIKKTGCPVTRTQMERMMIDSFEESFSGSLLRNAYAPKLEQLKKTFGLNGTEAELVCLLYCARRYNPLALLISTDRVKAFVEVAAAAIGHEEDAVKDAISPEGLLAASGILKLDNFPPPVVILNATIVSFLEGMISSNLCLRFVSTKDGPIIPLQRFEIADRQKQLLKSILMAPGPSQVLVSGAPGTGKTEFVRSILESAGRRAFFLSFSPREIDESSEDRRTRLRIATRTVACAGGVLVVDEAEDLLNSEDPMARKAERGWLVDFMESAAASVVWIITSTEFVYPSVLQRFTHSLELKSLGTTERRAVWQEFAAAQETAGLLREDEISDLAQTYEIDANGIATALRTIRGVKPGSALEAKAMLRDLLGSHARLLGMKSTAPTGRQSSRYDMLALHTDTDPKVILDYARRFCRQKDAHTDGEHLDNCAMLFWGPPGTGKTAFVHHMAKSISRTVHYKRASDLLGLYVGQSEKNIARAFHEASAEGAILFLDEADSFFRDREDAFHSWEVTIPNEFLTQVENFSGLIVCCTNRLSSLDPAVLRRFPWKVEFRPLTREGRVLLFQKYFGRDAEPLLDGILQRLEGMDGLTAGDYNAVYGLLERIGNCQQRQAQAIESLARERQYRVGHSERPIGFSAGESA